ncbi:MAG: hypothetical protein CMJ94_15960 [Planctomycetes bacterium]|nr:hypothetical protein [Planctomycetota bacterium]
MDRSEFVARRILAWALLLVSLRSAAALRGEGAGTPAWQLYRPDWATDGWRELATVPGVGAAQARAIVRGRAGHSGVLGPEQLQQLPGVGAKTAQAARAAARASAVEGPG